MSTPQGMLDGQSVTRPPYFKGQHYSRWKNQIKNYIQADKEEMTMFKKAKKNSKKKNSGKPRKNDQEQLTGCFKCGKHDHIVKNCPLLKKERKQEQFQKQGKK